MKIRTKMAIENYRGAVYFGTVSSLRKFFKGFIFFLVLAIAYLMLGQMGIIPYSQIINFIVTAYLVFMLVQFGRIELAIYRYTKRSDTLIGLDIIYTFNDKYFVVEIPSRNERNNYGVDRVMNVVEISTDFIIYMNASQTFVVPKNSLDAEELSDLRTYFVSHFRDRFSSSSFNKSTKSVGTIGRKKLF